MVLFHGKLAGPRWPAAVPRAVRYPARADTVTLSSSCGLPVSLSRWERGPHSLPAALMSAHFRSPLNRLGPIWGRPRHSIQTTEAARRAKARAEPVKTPTESRTPIPPLISIANPVTPRGL